MLGLDVVVGVIVVVGGSVVVVGGLVLVVLGVLVHRPAWRCRSRLSRRRRSRHGNRWRFSTPCRVSVPDGHQEGADSGNGKPCRAEDSLNKSAAIRR